MNSLLMKQVSAIKLTEVVQEAPTQNIVEGSTRKQVQRKMQRMVAGEDIEAYLAYLNKTTERKHLPESQLA